MSNKKVIIFYSWQSDLPSETNLKAIRNSLRNASNEIEAEPEDIKVEIDEATRNEAGSPDIPVTIFKKIFHSDIFICDLTTINGAETSSRKVPNPNVLIELGYAISTLGWERIIMLFNKTYGDFTKELPFDLEKRRITSFTIKEKADKSGKVDLDKKLSVAVSQIIKNNPIKPTISVKNNPEVIKRNSDIKNITTAFSRIHIGTIDFFIEELPSKIIGIIFYFWYDFEQAVKGNDFFLYDKEALKLIKDFKDLWGKVLSYADYSPSRNGENYIFYAPGDTFVSEQSEKNFRQIMNERQMLVTMFSSLVSYIRENYVEIDIDLLSEQAIRSYQDYKSGTSIG